MKLTRTPSRNRIHDYNLNLTKEEILCLAHDAISDWYYTNKLLEIIRKEAKRLGELKGESGKED